MEKQTGAATTQYLWDGDQVLKDYNGDGSVKASYFLGATGRQAIKSGGQWYIYLRDTHGSVTGLVDLNGNRVATYENGDYGEPLTDQGSIYNPYRWNAEQLDSESGLVYLRNRFYQPSTGRFLQRDPISYDGGLNLYSFCSGDPINFVDPDGLEQAPPGWSPTAYFSGQQAGPMFARPVYRFQTEGVDDNSLDALGMASMAYDLIFGGVKAGGFLARQTSKNVFQRIGPGKVVQLGKKGTDAERAFAGELGRMGNYVETRFGLEGVDFVVDGVEWEFKGMTANGKNTLQEAIWEGVKRNGASNVVVDGSLFEMTPGFVASQMNRLHGAGKLKNVSQLVIFAKNAIYHYDLH